MRTGLSSKTEVAFLGLSYTKPECKPLQMIYGEYKGVEIRPYTLDVNGTSFAVLTPAIRKIYTCYPMGIDYMVSMEGSESYFTLSAKTALNVNIGRNQQELMDVSFRDHGKSFILAEDLQVGVMVNIMRPDGTGVSGTKRISALSRIARDASEPQFRLKLNCHVSEPWLFSPVNAKGDLALIKPPK